MRHVARGSCWAGGAARLTPRARGLAHATTAHGAPDREVVEKAIGVIVAACRAAIAAAPEGATATKAKKAKAVKENGGDEEAGKGKEGRSRAPVVTATVDGVAVAARETVKAVEDMALIEKCVGYGVSPPKKVRPRLMQPWDAPLTRGPRFRSTWHRRRLRAAPSVTTYRLPSQVNTKASSSQLNFVERSRFLLGVYRHGLGAWEAIEADEELELKDKLLKAASSNMDRGKYSRLCHFLLEEILKACFTFGCAPKGRARLTVGRPQGAGGGRAHLQQLRKLNLKVSVKPLRGAPAASDVAAAGASPTRAAASPSSAERRSGGAGDGKDRQGANDDDDDDDDDDFADGAGKKRKMAVLKPPPDPPAKRRRSGSAGDGGRKASNDGKRASATKKGSKASSKAAPLDIVTRSPDGKRVRQTTLDKATGQVARKLPAGAEPPSDPISDAQPSELTEEELFVDRCRQFFLCVAASRQAI